MKVRVRWVGMSIFGALIAVILHYDVVTHRPDE